MSDLALAPVRTALYAISEYGEFFSLLDIAKVVKDELGLHPVFLFKADYGAIDAHSRILERLNYSWVSAHSVRQRFDARGVQPGISDYIPTSVLNKSSKPDGVPAQDEHVGQGGLKERDTFGLLLRGYGSLLLLQDRLQRRREAKQLARSMSRGAPVFRLSAFYKRELEVIEKIFSSFKPQIIISGQDYPLSITTFAAHIGAKHGIQTVIIPFSMTPTTKEIAESFFGSRTNEIRSRLALKVLGPKLGNWIHHYRGRIYTRLSPIEAIVSDSLGLTPAQPWTPNSGRGTIFAPSQQGYDYCLSAGIPENQLALTGAIWSDRLVNQTDTRSYRRDMLMRDILVFETYARNVSRARTVPRRPEPVRVEAADQARSILIFSWPPNQSPRRPNGLASFEQLNKALAEMLIALAMSASVKIAISLHPTLVDTPLGAELKGAGLYVIDKPLIDVIDCADIFCATVSSTLLWSVQLATPSVNFDIYSYGYQEFTEAGMSEVSTIPALRNELLQLIEDEQYRGSVVERTKERRDFWTLSDGRAQERILEAIRLTISS